MVVALTKTSDGSPVGSLAAYAATSAAIPISPSDTSGQLPTFSATLADRKVNVETLPGTKLTLEDWTGIQNTGTVKAVKRSPTSGLVNLDMSTVLDKVNTTQSTMPVILTDDTGDPRGTAISHWITTCGVTPVSLDGSVLQYLGQGNPYGYIKNNFTRFNFRNTVGSYSNYAVTSMDQPAKLMLNPAQGIVFGVSIPPLDGGEAVFMYNLPSGQVACMRLTGSFSNWALIEEVLPTIDSPIGSSGTGVNIATLDHTPVGSTPVYLLAKVTVNASDVTKRDIVLRIIEWDSVNKVSALTDSATYTVTSNLTDGLTTAGVKLYPNGDHSFVTDTSVFQSSYPKPVFKMSFSLTPPAGTVAYKVPGFTGNVWQSLTQYCSLVEADMSEKVDSLTGATYFNFSERLATDTPVAIADIMQDIEVRNTARSVQVVLREVLGTDSTFNNNLLWKATSVYSLNQGEYREEIVQTTSSYVSLAQPVCVTGEPVPYNLSYGSYVITGNDGFIVDPQWWADNGGSIKVAPTGKSGEIKIKLQAPTVDTTRAPYRVSEGVADRPALYIFGKGINLSAPTTLTMYTGAESAQDVGVTFDSPFVTRKLMALNTGYKLAKDYGTANTTLTFRMPRGSASLVAGQTNLIPAGNTIMWHGSNYRVSQQTVDPAGVGVTKADIFTTIKALNAEFCTGKTVADWRNLHAGQTIKEVNLTPMPRSER